HRPQRAGPPLPPGAARHDAPGGGPRRPVVPRPPGARPAQAAADGRLRRGHRLPLAQLAGILRRRGRPPRPLRPLRSLLAGTAPGGRRQVLTPLRVFGRLLRHRASTPLRPPVPQEVVAVPRTRLLLLTVVLTAEPLAAQEAPSRLTVFPH